MDRRTDEPPIFSLPLSAERSPTRTGLLHHEQPQQQLVAQIDKSRCTDFVRSSLWGIMHVRSTLWASCTTQDEAQIRTLSKCVTQSGNLSHTRTPLQFHVERISFARGSKPDQGWLKPLARLHGRDLSSISRLFEISPRIPFSQQLSVTKIMSLTILGFRD